MSAVDFLPIGPERTWATAEMVAALQRRGGAVQVIHAPDLDELEDRLLAGGAVDENEATGVETAFWLAFGERFRP